ncbi:uncharacterized protein LOC134237078 [Saccostrea cucullata]|uniref:uncharacterized protein LOC134237078 n=1 Tax=Saccostrea cuccullata TaxID=36930 RepID=UPI002ED3386D
MDHLCSAQVALLCDLCQMAELQSHCELCQINLCKACVGEHFSDSSKRHNVVPYTQRVSAPHFPKCPNHTQNRCEFHCNKCNIPVCSICLSNIEHKGHDVSNVLQKQLEPVPPVPKRSMSSRKSPSLTSTMGPLLLQLKEEYREDYGRRGQRTEAVDKLRNAFVLKRTDIVVDELRYAFEFAERLCAGITDDFLNGVISRLSNTAAVPEAEIRRALDRVKR